jgi:hypothetical protein
LGKPGQQLADIYITSNVSAIPKQCQREREKTQVINNICHRERERERERESFNITILEFENGIGVAMKSFLK